MSEIKFNTNSAQTLLTAEIIEEFIRNRNLSFRKISSKSGINFSNLSRCLSGKSSLTLPYFIRIVAASGSDEIYDSVFDFPVKRYLVQSVRTPGVCSGTDYVCLALMLKDYFAFQNEHNSEDMLNAVFYVLSKNLFNRYTNDDHYNEQNMIENRVRNFCNMFYDQQNPIAYSFPKNPISDHRLGMLMSAGGTVLWQDIKNLLAWYLSENNQKLSQLKSNYVLNRIKNSSEQSYKVDDLLEADNEMQANGIFFSACCLAAKNNILLSKMCTDESSKDTGLIQKVQYGVTSFFSCLRILEHDTGRSQNLKGFWSFFRQTAADSQYYMAQLRDLSEMMPEYFPRKSLLYYTE